MLMAERACMASQLRKQSLVTNQSLKGMCRDELSEP